MPEKTKGSVYSARVARKMKGMGIDANQLKETTAYRSAMELQASSDRAATTTLDEGGQLPWKRPQRLQRPWTRPARPEGACKLV